MLEPKGRSIQLLAWLVLLGSFVAFVAGVVGIPWLAFRWMRESTRPLPALVSCKTGSCALSVHGAVPVAQRMESGPAEVPEGTTFATDSRSKGFVRLFDGSTANLEPNTSVTLEYMRRPRFSTGTTQPTAAVWVDTPANGEAARLSVGTTWEQTLATVQTEHGSVRIEPESRIRLEVRAEGMRLVVYEGGADVTGAGRSVHADADEAVESSEQSGPTAPRSAIENVLADSDLDGPAEDQSWKEYVNLLGSVGVVPPTAEYTTLEDGTSIVRIVRENSESRTADMVMEQALFDRDVTWSQQIGVRARLRINAQSLPLGGTLAQEFPVRLKLVGETETGNQLDWLVSFYAVLPPEDEPPDKFVARPTDVYVPLGEWYEFDSGNLLDPESEFSFSRFDWPSPPVRLERFEIIASGHDYAADIDMVEVWVK